MPAAFVTIVFVAEGDLLTLLIERNDSAVTDGDSMGVSREIG